MKVAVYKTVLELKEFIENFIRSILPGRPELYLR
jgi:hypothetical protein